MQFTSITAVLALVGFAVAVPAPNKNKCETEWKTSTVTASSACPIVSLPLSPIVTGTLVPVGSITSKVGGILGRAPEPTAAPAALEARGGCKVYSTKTVTTTVKPKCGVVNPGSV